MKISRNKDRQIVLKQSKDIYNDILLPLKERSQDNGNNVLFYRIIGFDDQTEFINQAALLHEKLVNLGNLYLYFIEEIPLPFNRNLTRSINAAFSGVNSFQTDALCDILEVKNLFPTTAAVTIKDSFKTILELYLKNEPSANIGMVKNFVSKLLLWLHEHMSQLYKTNSPWNPKILYYGGIKKHYVYYLILLSRIGCDVLYINPYYDLNYPKVDRSNRFSMLVEGKTKVKLDHPPIKAVTKPAEPVSLEASDKIVPVTGHTAMVKLKRSNDIFRDILLPLNKRSGYLGNPAPIIPVYFYRHIGINENTDAAIDEYYNAICRLDKTLQNRPNGYLRLTGYVAMPGNNEITAYKAKLQQARPTMLQGSEKDFLINRFINAKILPITKSKPLNNTIKTAFRETIDLFAQIGKNSSASKIENFALKLIGWVNKYFAALYRSYDFQDNPKVLYYGEIKAHEAYFLIYLSKIGCDVLFINSDIEKDNPFKQIDPEQKHTKLIQYEQSKELEQFPESERTIRKATVAYNAAQEIEQIIYTEDVGLFKPWQFENSMTRPVTLKTTYDELKILWQEEAKIRPEFKVIDNDVYVPNLFAKIKGTHEDLTQYWRDYRLLTAAKNTFSITNVPFTEVSYSKRDLYASAFLFNGTGLVDQEKLLKSSFYKFSFLKNPLQEFIINKTNELINSDVFINSNNKELKLKILMTILTMNENILRLIETFDFPAEVPKLVIYDGTKNIFSDEDAIIIAFLNLVGIDIAIFTPTNYNNLELKLKEDLLDIHQLPEVQLDLPTPDLINLPTDENKFSTFLNNVSQKIRRKFH